MAVFQVKPDQLATILVNAKNEQSAKKLFNNFKKALQQTNVNLKQTDDNVQIPYPTVFIWYFPNSKNAEK